MRHWKVLVVVMMMLCIGGGVLVVGLGRAFGYGIRGVGRDVDRRSVLISREVQQWIRGWW